MATDPPLLATLERLDREIVPLDVNPLMGLLVDASTHRAFTEFDGKSAKGICALRNSLPELIRFVEAADRNEGRWPHYWSDGYRDARAALAKALEAR